MMILISIFNAGGCLVFRKSWRPLNENTREVRRLNREETQTRFYWRRLKSIRYTYDTTWHRRISSIRSLCFLVVDPVISLSSLRWRWTSWLMICTMHYKVFCFDEIITCFWNIGVFLLLGLSGNRSTCWIAPCISRCTVPFTHPSFALPPLHPILLFLINHEGRRENLFLVSG